VESLAVADQVVIASVFYKSTDALKPEERLNVDSVVAELKDHGVAARQLPDVAAIVSEVAPSLASGDVVAILSNGGFGDIYEKLPAALASRSLRTHPTQGEHA
jgi:UDP-N-acetylmuramate: L-alanyl-gamma-D-glutamyl-meso-diaminopimelate ligase